MNPGASHLLAYLRKYQGHGRGRASLESPSIKDLAIKSADVTRLKTRYGPIPTGCATFHSRGFRYLLWQQLL